VCHQVETSLSVEECVKAEVMQSVCAEQEQRPRPQHWLCSKVSPSYMKKTKQLSIIAIAAMSMDAAGDCTYHIQLAEESCDHHPKWLMKLNANKHSHDQPIECWTDFLLNNLNIRV